MIIRDIEPAELSIDMMDALRQRMKDELHLSDQEIEQTIEFADRAKAPLGEFVYTLIRIRAGKD